MHLMTAGVGMVIIGVLLMALIQISIFRSFPKQIKWLFSAIPILGMACNFLLSSVILFFTGVGNFIGFMNMGGSVLLGLYILYYAKYHQVEFRIKFIYGVVPRVILRAKIPEEGIFI